MVRPDGYGKPVHTVRTIYLQNAGTPCAEFCDADLGLTGGETITNRQSQDGYCVFIVEEIGENASRADCRKPTLKIAFQTLANSGPGQSLRQLLSGWPFYIATSPGCSCLSMAAQMDAWGCDECSRPERIEEVVSVMREEAHARGLPFLDVAGRMLVRRAIHNARKAEARRAKEASQAAAEGRAAV